jgi:hypothetical protein
VALTQNGTTVDVVVDLFNSFQFAKTGSVDFQAFKFNATGVVVDDISVNQNSSEPPVYPIRLPPLGVKPMFKNRLSFVESWIHQPA